MGTTSAITSLAYQLKIPQGQLAGEKASMTALLKIACPVIYSWLYLMGKNMEGKNSQNALGAFVGKKLPFVLNLILGMMAFVVTWQNL